MRAFYSFLKFVCFAVLVQFFALQIVKANPEGGQVVGGSAQITQAGKLLEVQQSSQRAVIDWRSFDIGVDEHTRFIQPNANALALNRIKSLNASQIAGKLSANGNVVLVNPNGVFFRAGSQVDVNGLIASTSGIAAADFMAGSNHFNILGDPNAAIVNHGLISASEAGLIGLVAPQVENHGILQATAGRVQLSAGEVFTLDFSGDALLQVAVPSSQLDGLRALNTGTIAAEGGAIAISASAAKDALDSLVVVDGHLQATGAHQDAAGTIHIGNPSTAAVSINGALAADSIKVRGQAIAVNDTAKLQATERISVGGDYLGGDGIGNAQTVRVEAGAELRAGNPADQGDGEIIVWSDDTTQFAGYAEAAFVETSGKRTLKIGESARVNTYGGLWLLDPQDFVIANSDGDMTAGTLQTNLANGNVAILSSGGGQAGNGDIIIRDDFSYSANELTLTAARDVSVEAVVGVDSDAALTINTATTNGGDAADSDGKLRMQLDSGGFQGRIDYTSTGDLKINGDVYTIINSRAELDNMRDDLDGHYALGANIDLGGSSNKWTPVGSYNGADKPHFWFRGDFEGLGHTLDNLYIDRSVARNGLFGYTDSANVSNVGIINGTIQNTSNHYSGLLIGQAFDLTSIVNCYSTGLVNNNNAYCGGLVGILHKASVDSSYSTATVKNHNNDGIGGLIGFARDARITNSYATGDVTDNKGKNGGLIGQTTMSNTGGSVTEVIGSYATGQVSSNSGDANGGLIGYAFNTEITGSHATGLVSNNTGNSKGGLVGYTEATTISDSYATGDVTDNTGFEHGGLVGYANATSSSNSNYLNAGKTVIKNSYAAGDVTNNLGSDYESFSGGLVGLLEASNIQNSYAMGTVSSQGHFIGGLVGDADHEASITDCYATGNITGDRDGYGGLVGYLNRYSSITNSYATGNVTGDGEAYGGLVGYSERSSIIAKSYATGTISGSGDYRGGLLGKDDGSTTFTGNSFYNTNNDHGIGEKKQSGIMSIGGLSNSNVVGLDLSAFTDASNFTNAAWDIAEIGGQNTVWRIYDGHSTPLLAHFLTDISFDSGTGNSLEKVYDGSAIDASGAGLTLASGAFKAGDSVTDLGGSISGTALNQSNVGSYLLDTNFYSTDQQGYDIENLTGGTLTITQKALTISGLSVDNKTYDGTTAATATGTAMLGGVVNGDNITLGGSPGFTFTSANVGTGINVSTSGYTISGTDSGNYTLTQPTLIGNITAKALTISGTSIAAKTYDGTTAAGAVTVGSLSGLVGTESLSVSGSAANLSSANAGSYNTTVSYTLSDVTGANGGLAANYSLADDDAVSASITKKALTIGDASIAAKTYDGTTAAGAVTVGSLSGLVGTESLSVSGSAANLSSANAGSYNTTVSYTLSDVTGANGGLAANYSLADDDAVSATIAQKALTFSKPTVADKTYDGSDSVTFDESEISFFTPVKGDTIDYKLSGEFTSSTVGKAIPVNVVVQLLGESALNYSLTQANFKLFADIKSALPKSLYKELAQASAPAASPETVVQAAPQFAMQKPVSQVRSGRSTGRGANRIKPQLAPSLSNSQLTIEQVQAPEENTSVAALDESTATESKLEIQNSMNLAIEETLVAELGLGQLFDVPLNGNKANVSSESNDLLPNAL